MQKVSPGNRGTSGNDANVSRGNAGGAVANSQKNEQFNFQEPGFRYSLARTQVEVTYSVSNGAERMSADAVWAFGAGEVGQTYILEKDGSYVESRISYIVSSDSMDISPGHPIRPPGKIEEALGRKMDSGSTRLCFGCHNTAATTSQRSEPEKATPGVTCEACHGPGAKHVEAMNGPAESRTSTAILNPADLSSADSVDFCGACHRTSADVEALMPANSGVLSIRFQPYRLEKSRCWKACITCHDPHKPLVRELSAYDSKCIACHSAKPGRQEQMAVKTACKVGSSDCASCHMPKYEVPQVHAQFTEHYIRVVSATEQKGALVPE